MFSRIRAAMVRAEDHWLTLTVGVCLLFSILPGVMFLGLALGAAP